MSNMWYIPFMAHLIVRSGPMFSGKTEELIRILRRFDIARKKIVVVKPSLDVRSADEIASRRTSGGQSKDFSKSGSFPATPIQSVEELRSLMEKEQPNILAVDEAQFFEQWLVDYLTELLYARADDDKFTILVGGLDMDAWGKPFGIMPQLMAIANEVQKLTAICDGCGDFATMTQKLVSSDQQVEVGDSEIYEARCRKCHVPPHPMETNL